MAGEGQARGEGVPAALAFAVFCVAAAVLFFEVALSRVFSVLLRFHFVFLVISCAIAGLGVGGMLSVSCSRAIRERLGDRRALALFSGLVGASMPACMVLLVQTPLSRYLYNPLVIPAVAFFPFLFAGAFLSYAFHVYHDSAGILYFADLAGAATGALGVVLALDALGGMCTPVAAGLLGVAGSLALVLRRGAGAREMFRRAAPLAAAGVATVALLVLAVQGRALGIPKMAPPAGEAQAWVKLLQEELRDPRARIVATEWNAFARTDVVRCPDAAGLSVYTDGDVPSQMLPFSGDLSWYASGEGLLYFPPFAAFAAGPRESVLCLGPGGGMDVLLAFMAGAKRIVGVELNPSIPRIMYRFRKYNGYIYARRNFELYVAEGRAFVAASREKFDLIYLALTKTATSPTGGLALAESYVATEEAFADYLEHLTERGRLAFVCQEDVLARRAFLTALAVFEKQGVAPREACRRLALLGATHRDDVGPYRFVLLVRRRPFSERDLDALLELCRVANLLPLFVYGRAEDYAYFSRFVARGHSVARYVADQPENVEPATDDRPFFVDIARGLSLPLWRILGVGLAGAVLSAGLWGWAWRGEERRRAVTLLYGYFALLGVGFMLIEVALIQKFILILGYPTLAFSVILFALLLAGSAGSYLSQRLPVHRARETIRAAALCAALLVGLCYAVLRCLGEQMLALPILWRSLATMALLFPLGVALGMLFPTGVRVAGRALERHVPRLWGVNGLTSMTGSVLAMVGAKFVGFSGILEAGAAVYLALVLLAGPLAEAALGQGRGAGA